MSAAPRDTTNSSTQSPIHAIRNTPRGCNGLAATLIRPPPMSKLSVGPCTALQTSGPAELQPASVPDPDKGQGRRSQPDTCHIVAVLELRRRRSDALRRIRNARGRGRGPAVVECRKCDRRAVLSVAPLIRGARRRYPDALRQVLAGNCERLKAGKMHGLVRIISQSCRSC
jgi:hypothetical protein